MKVLFTLIFTVISTVLSFAQFPEERYEKASYYLINNLEKEIYHLEVKPNWIKGSSDFWHISQTENGKRFFLTDTKGRKTLEFFDHQKLAALLSTQSGEEVSPSNLPFEKLQVKEKNVIEFEWRNRDWTYRINEGKLDFSPKDHKKPVTGISPDGQWRAFSKEYNLFVENLNTGETIQLSHAGKKGLEYASSYGWSDLIKGEDGVRPEHFNVSWSPDSKKILTNVIDLRVAEKMYLLDFSQEDKFRPDLYSYYRASPGDTTTVQVIPVLFDVENQKELLLTSLKRPHFMSTNLRWQKGSKALRGLYFERGFKKVHILEVGLDGSFRDLFSDAEDTFVNRDLLFHQFQNGNFIISSEKSGWNHLYYYDDNGRLIMQLTNGDFVVNKIAGVQEEQQLLFFEASGKEANRNPYFNHLYKIKLDGTGLTLLTPENAYHEVSLSPDYSTFVDNYSRPDLPGHSVLRSAKDGKILHEISKADISNLNKRNYKFPDAFSATAKDGKTEIHGLYFVPSDFDVNRKYPVIDYTYTGPHTASTPKTFKSAILNHPQQMAELGFIVVMVDGLGTAGRGKAFQNHSYRNLGDGTTDHVLAIKQLAEKVNFIDIDKIGIYGHSAGGYDAARAMLLHPEFYKVGVSSAGDHDHRMEKAWWPEMFMGYPVEDYYHEQSNITNADKLQGRLLIAHGAMDENVNPSASYKFAEALIDAGKDFDFFIWPSRNHSFGRATGDYFTKKRWDYFIEHLMGEEPIRNWHPEGLK
ncbi:MAG: Xaa-Pro dipeptidase [Mongoliibacter sp.]|uniref:S9 family peptidase n=1 Tax=Mongoliibacter sp. TaxID=2022438 RepID=UPI0012F05346|nr:DPP IV N-terminal domain-containing protein [Mongoliibacter sp.]TVP47597.1 MAG: Xaa-Pro dipeptidase [Mongoliibacter sp.]